VSKILENAMLLVRKRQLGAFLMSNSLLVVAVVGPLLYKIFVIHVM